MDSKAELIKEGILTNVENNLSNAFKKDMDKLNSKNVSVEDITKEMDESVKSGDKMLEIAERDYTPSLSEDIVFGEDEWTPRERFAKQKQQLNSIIFGYYALYTYQDAIEKAQNGIDAFNDFNPLDAKKYADSITSEEVIERQINEALHVIGKRVEVYKHYLPRDPKRVKIFGFICLFIALACLVGVIIGAINLGKVLDSTILFVSTTLLMCFYIVLAVVSFVNANRFQRNNEKVSYYLESHDALMEAIMNELPEIINKHVNEYNDFASSFAKEKEPAVEKYQSYLPILQEKLGKAQLFVSKFRFCRDMPFSKIKAVHKAMENGLADSYTSALQYVNSEEQRQKDKEEERAYRERMEAANKEHNEQMEKMAKEQLESQKRAEQAAVMQAKAASEAAAEAAKQSEYAKQQTKLAEQEAKDIRELKKKVNDYNNNNY